MVTEIDALRTRLEDPTETFTVAEVTALIEWAERHALTDAYQQARIATIMQESVAIRESTELAMQQLIAMWDATPVVPTLLEVPYEQA